MELARVVGQCTATVKESSLDGRKLALVCRTSISGEQIGEVEVALDVTGAAPGQLVIITRGSAARQPVDNRQLAVDLSVIAIVDAVTNELADSPKSQRKPIKKSVVSQRARSHTGGK